MPSQVAAQATQMEASASLEKVSGRLEEDYGQPEKDSGPEKVSGLEKASGEDEAAAPGAARAGDEDSGRREENAALLQRAVQAYARVSGSAFPAPWGSGISLAV